ncbi:hypothetical protein D3C75_490030 [compost metagenome]
MSHDGLTTVVTSNTIFTTAINISEERCHWLVLLTWAHLVVCVDVQNGFQHLVEVTLLASLDQFFTLESQRCTRGANGFQRCVDFTVTTEVQLSEHIGYVQIVSDFHQLSGAQKVFWFSACTQSEVFCVRFWEFVSDCQSNATAHHALAVNAMTDDAFDRSSYVTIDVANDHLPSGSGVQHHTTSW